MQRWHGMSSRPTGVTIIGVFNAFASAAILLAYPILGLKVPTITLAVAIIVLASSLGMLTGFTWAWYLTILGYVINIIIGFVFLFSQVPTEFVSILLSKLIIFYLSQDHVRKFLSVGTHPSPQ